MVTIITAAINV